MYFYSIHIFENGKEAGSLTVGQIRIFANKEKSAK